MSVLLLGPRQENMWLWGPLVPRNQAWVGRWCPSLPLVIPTLKGTPTTIPCGPQRPQWFTVKVSYGGYPAGGSKKGRVQHLPVGQPLGGGGPLQELMLTLKMRKWPSKGEGMRTWWVTTVACRPPQTEEYVGHLLSTLTARLRLGPPYKHI